MEKKKLRTYPVPALPERTGAYGEEVLVHARVESIDGEAILIAHFFAAGESRYNGSEYVFEPYPQVKLDHRVFCAKDSFLAQRINDETGKLKWSESTVSSFHGGCFWNDDSHKSHFAYTDEESMVIGVKFFGQGTDTAQAIHKFQKSLRGLQLAAKKRRTQDETDEIMTLFDDPPKGFYNWVNNVAFEESRYIFYERKGKKIYGKCTECNEAVLLTSAHHNDKCKCPNCGKYVVLKSSGISTMVKDESRFAYISKANDKLAIRYFTAKKCYWEYPRDSMKRTIVTQPVILYYEHTRILVAGNRAIQTYEEINDWRTGHTAQWRLTSSDMLTRRYAISTDYVYPGNLDEQLRGTPWQYSQLTGFSRVAGKVDILNYLSKYLQYPFIEYLHKLGLNKMLSGVLSRVFVHDVLKTDGKTPMEMLGVEKQDIEFLRADGISLDELSLFKKLKARNERLTHEGVIWYRALINQSLTDPLMQHMTFQRCMNYTNKQCKRRNMKAGDVLIEWVDCLRMAQDEGYDMESNSVLFPSNLKLMHDNLMYIYNKRETEKHEAGVRKHAKKNEHLNYSTDKFEIHVAKTAMEIKYEGSSLGHCVGGYMRRVEKGETTILMVRRKAKPNKPYFTLEYKDDRIVQCRGKGNTQTNDEVQKFIDSWKEHITKQANKSRRVTA